MFRLSAFLGVALGFLSAGIFGGWSAAFIGVGLGMLLPIVTQIVCGLTCSVAQRVHFTRVVIIAKRIMVVLQCVAEEGSYDDRNHILLLLTQLDELVSKLEMMRTSSHPLHSRDRAWSQHPPIPKR